MNQVKFQKETELDFTHREEVIRSASYRHTTATAALPASVYTY
jgi:hypothetical protein